MEWACDLIESLLEKLFKQNSQKTTPDIFIKHTPGEQVEEEEVQSERQRQIEWDTGQYFATTSTSPLVDH